MQIRAYYHVHMVNLWKEIVSEQLTTLKRSGLYDKLESITIGALGGILESNDLEELIKESGDKYIETDNIVDVYDNKLPAPLTKEEVRDAKINIINSDDSK